VEGFHGDHKQTIPAGFPAISETKPRSNHHHRLAHDLATPGDRRNHEYLTRGAGGRHCRLPSSVSGYASESDDGPFTTRRGFQQFLKRNLAAITITGLLMILLLLAIAVITAIAVEQLLETPPGWSACDSGIAVTIGIRFRNGVVVTREDSVHHTGLLMILLLLAIAVITAIAVEPFHKVLVVNGPSHSLCSQQPARGS
jgi:hypothetical protein